MVLTRQRPIPLAEWVISARFLWVEERIEIADLHRQRLSVREIARDLDHPTIEHAGHFLQEDAGAGLGRMLAGFIESR